MRTLKQIDEFLIGNDMITVYETPVGKIYVTEENGLPYTIWDTALTSKNTLLKCIEREDNANKDN